jgi:hypothetical protein
MQVTYRVLEARPLQVLQLPRLLSAATNGSSDGGHTLRLCHHPWPSTHCRPSRQPTPTLLRPAAPLRALSPSMMIRNAPGSARSGSLRALTTRTPGPRYGNLYRRAPGTVVGTRSASSEPAGRAVLHGQVNAVDDDLVLSRWLVGNLPWDVATA